jgi:hypothetical protein
VARIRSVHPDICGSDTMATLPAELERTFVRLWTHCDDEGRCEDRPRIIKAGIYPVHDEMTWQRIDAELTELHNAGLIVRYEASGKRYIAVKSWHEYQHPQRPRKSDHPTPPENAPPPPRTLADVSRNGAGGVREHASTSPGLELGEGEGEGVGGGDGRGESEGGALVCPLNPDAERLCHLLADCIGQRGSKRPTVTKRWLTDMDRLLRLDGREPNEVERVVRWLDSARDDIAAFWQPNVRSPGTLRAKWDQMSEQYARRRRPTSRQQRDDQAWEDSQTILRVVPTGVNPIDLKLRGVG